MWPLACLRCFDRSDRHSVLSSPNPWVQAELQQALQVERDGLPDSSQEEGNVNSSGGAVEATGDALLEAKGEVVVVRVALPSAAEREQVRARSESNGYALRSAPVVIVVVLGFCDGSHCRPV